LEGDHRQLGGWLAQQVFVLLLLLDKVQPVLFISPNHDFLLLQGLILGVLLLRTDLRVHRVPVDVVCHLLLFQTCSFLSYFLLLHHDQLVFFVSFANCLEVFLLLLSWLGRLRVLFICLFSL